MCRFLESFHYKSSEFTPLGLHEHSGDLVHSVTCKTYLSQHTENEILGKLNHNIKQYPAAPKDTDFLQLRVFLRFSGS